MLAVGRLGGSLGHSPATVITSMLSALPWVGQSLTESFSALSEALSGYPPSLARSEFSLLAFSPISSLGLLKLNDQRKTSDGLPPTLVIGPLRITAIEDLVI